MRSLAFAIAFAFAPAFAQSPAPSTSEVREAIDALHHVENRLQSLEREVNRLAALRESDPQVRQAIDELRAQSRALEQRLASTQARLYELEATTPTGRFGYDEGLYFRAAPVEVVLNGVLQPRYTGARVRGGPDVSSVDLHHAQIMLRGSYGRWISIYLMLDFGSLFIGAGRAQVLRDAFVDVTPTSWLRIRLGQFKVPFSRQQWLAETRQSFVERALATRAFAFDRDLGGMIEGAFFDARLIAQFSLSNGVRAGPVVVNDNLDLAYSARIVAQPLGALIPVEGDGARTRRPRFAVGLAVHYDLMPLMVDVDRNGRNDNVAALSLGVEAALKFRGLAVDGEYFWRREDFGAGRLPVDRHGGYAQATMMIWSGLYAGARFSYAQISPLNPLLLGVLGDQPREALEASAVAGWYLWSERNKAQVSYSYRRDDALGRTFFPEAHIVEVQLQAGF